MRLKIFAIFFVFLLSISAQASSKFTAMMGYGLDARAERDQEQSVLPRYWHSIVLGAGYKPWMGLFEYSTFNEASGNDTLSVTRKTETALLWLQWHTEDAWAFRPYIGLGLGGYREVTDSTFYADTRTDQSEWAEHIAGAIGLRWATVSPMWLSIEGRLHSNKYLDPSPMLGLLLRIGLVLE